MLERVRTSRQPLIITQRGRAAAVMPSVEEYERTENERYTGYAVAGLLATERVDNVFDPSRYDLRTLCRL